MAINNGNHSFMLTTVQKDTKTLTVSWYESNIKPVPANPIILHVRRPGDGAVVLTKHYSSGEINDIFDVKVPYPGEYNVHISTARGYVNDNRNVMMMVRETVTDTKVLTTSDINLLKAGEVLSVLIGAALPIGGAALMTLKIGTKLSAGKRVISSILFALGIGQIALRDASVVGLPEPTVGDKIKTTLRHVGDGYEIAVVYEQTKDAAGNGGGIYYPRTDTFKYLKY